MLTVSFSAVFAIGASMVGQEKVEALVSTPAQVVIYGEEFHGCIPFWYTEALALGSRRSLNITLQSLIQSYVEYLGPGTVFRLEYLDGMKPD